MDSALIRRAAPLIPVVFAIYAFATGRSMGARPDLTGLWTFNQDLSDDPAKVMAGIQAQRHGGSAGGREHGPGMHGGGGMGGGRREMDPEQMRAHLNRAIEPPVTLTITQTDSSITFIDGDGRSQTLRTNNKKQKLPLDERTVAVKTKWDDERLVKETSLGDGMKLTETYSLNAEPRQLLVWVQLTSSRLPRPVNLRRVYDAESPRGPS